MEPLLEQLHTYGQSDYYPYHMPGHKRNVGLFGEIARMDITEIEGFDNLHQPEGILRQLQEEAAALYHAEQSFYLVNGSTVGVLSAISAALPEGGQILMARNSHQSAYHGAYLRKLRISYLYPPLMAQYDICDAITPGQVREALRKESGIQAVFVTSPTYEGRIADIVKIAQEAHSAGVPLIVDEAHGAHLGLAEGFGKNSCQAGADVVIHSVHKTLPGLTQAALLHANGNLVSREALRKYLHIYQTSSPSYLLMASIDNALRIAREQGEVLFAQFQAQYEAMLEELSSCRYLRFLSAGSGSALVGSGWQDVGKLVISTRSAGILGQELYDILLERYHLQLEMASASYCLAMFTIADGREAYERMTAALLQIDKDLAAGCLGRQQSSVIALTDFSKEMSVAVFLQDRNEPPVPLADAWDAEKEWVPLAQATGRLVGEFVSLYPPGIPLLAPGETITAKHCQALAEYLRQGLKTQGVQLRRGQYCVSATTRK